MRIFLASLAAAALSAGSTSGAFAASCTMTGMMMGPAMPHCTPVTGPVVWLVTTAKLYYLKGSPMYGKGKGAYVCRATAVARGAHPGRSTMGGPHGTMGGSHDTMGGSHGPSLPVTKTMVPRPMSSASPPSGGNPMSGNQGNTGAPGAGGQVPNNPASSSNNNPSPSPSPRP
jgi:hypothetical protein